MKKWKPTKNEKYYAFDMTLKVWPEVWTDHITDNNKYEAGNCFKTRQEAEEAAGAVKKLLKKRQEKNEKKKRP